MTKKRAFTRKFPCPICGGYDEQKRNRGERCFGFLSADGNWANCTREEYAGGLMMFPKSKTYGHKLYGRCKCGDTHNPEDNGTMKQIIAKYDYVDENGELLYQVCRMNPKGFFQRRPDSKDGWINNLKGVRRVLYHLPELISADKSATVFICEGEKDVDALIGRGLVATTNAGGAEKWLFDYNENLKGRSVVILPDNDEPGRKHAMKIAKGLNKLGVSVKIVELPNLPEKGDVSDWLAAGGTVEQLHDLVESAPFFSPDENEHEEDDEIGEEETEDDEDVSLTFAPGRPSQATQLVELAGDAELFTTPEGDGYATISVDNRFETWSLKSKGFKNWLARRFYETHGSAVSSNSLKDALGVLDGKALFEGESKDVYTRIAEHEGAIYLDLADVDWRAVKVTAEGWEVVQNPPVKFRRTRGMLSLPIPVTGGALSELDDFINVQGEDHVLIKAWLVAALRPRGPYPILVFHGEQGSAKTTTARVLCDLTDPNAAALRSEPRDERDMVIAATNRMVVAYDNLSKLPQWLSDALCRLSTGGGYATRELFSDGDEKIFNVQRPALLTGIEELATRGDLLSRCIIVYLPTISKEKRRPEDEFERDFQAARPRILGALLEAVSAGLRNLESVKVDLPRLADFTKFIIAAEGAMGLKDGEFMQTYGENIDAASGLALEVSPVASSIRSFMKGMKEWNGTALELLGQLNLITDEYTRKQNAWPKLPQKLSNDLRRLAPNLRENGIDVNIGLLREPGTGRRLIRIKQVSNPSSQASQASQPAKSNASGMTASDGSSQNLFTLSQASSHSEVTESGARDERDTCDGTSHSFEDCYDCQERAAIREFDGRLPREEAERLEKPSTQTGGRRPVSEVFGSEDKAA